MRIKHRPLLSKEDFGELEQGKMYGVYAEPGAGKTHMIKNALMEYCRENKKTAIYLVHRLTLKEQTEADIEKELEKFEQAFFGNGFTIMTYQSIEYAYKHNLYHRVEPFLNSDFVICDESHYFVKDSWNEQTDYSVQFMEESQGTKIFLTGTPKEMHVLSAMWDIETLVTTNRQNNNLKAIRIYDKDTDLLRHISQYANDECKVFSFVSGKTELVLGMKNEHGGAFVVSKHNELYEEADHELIDIVVKGEQGKHNGILSTDKVWSTSVWNEGVNIIDENLGVVCSFRPRSSTEFIQQFARARRSDIIGCIVAPTAKMLVGYRKKCEEELEEILVDDRRRFNPHFMKMRELCLIESIGETNQMLHMGFGQYVASIYTDIPVYNYGQIMRDKRLSEYLNTLVDVKLFEYGQGIFKENMFEVHGFRDKNRKKILGKTSFNSFLKEAGIKYELDSKKERSTKSEYFGKTYWVIKMCTQNDASPIYSNSVKISTQNDEIMQDDVSIAVAQEDDFNKQLSAFKFKSNQTVDEGTNLMLNAFMNKGIGA
ncbi:DEAD/DEAH box helicase family protein [Priestia aryabhattai]|uniref:DEAD/DEAH box helicase family protein n=1 Tax=Priestia aryabhattai TaxID=412384 RepID=UPI00211B773D|nr:DEAD/DEAH box helicase family protein [Priestia aryabhattai]MCQ9281725.1 DEAD/DEAH box helicase family protein [Priestia aryabhattai]